MSAHLYKRIWLPTVPTEKCQRGLPKKRAEEVSAHMPTVYDERMTPIGGTHPITIGPGSFPSVSD